tara:strand:- start:1023 stop:1421 length:399 start_codon:yes stop_codon:yes gene_type:complete
MSEDTKMAITIRKTRTGILVPNSTSVSSKYFSESEEEIVTEQIRLILKDSLRIRGKMDVRRIEYFVVYCADEKTYEKQISKIHMRHKITGLTDCITANQVEATGVHLIEFFDYVNTHGATEIQDKCKILELV